MEKLSYNQLNDLMSKIKKSMTITREKNRIIAQKEKQLYKETNMLNVEEGKKQLENLKNDKKEFDEMTTRALMYSKLQIIAIREQLEKDYQKKLLEHMSEKKNIEKRVKAMQKRATTDKQKLRIANIAQSVSDNLEKEMKNYQEEYFKKIGKLDSHEKDVEKYGLELGVEDKVGKVQITKTVVPTEPQVSEQETSVEPQANEQETLVEPQVSEQEIPVEPQASEQETSVEPQASEQETSVEPQVNEQETSVEPQASEQETSVEPQVNEQETSVEPQASEQETSVEPQATTPIEKKDKIVIARKGEIVVDGKKYKISKKIIKDGVALTENEKLDILLANEKCEQYLEGKTPEEKKAILKGLDGAIINSICEAKFMAYKENDIKKLNNLMYQYITGIESVKSGKSNKFEVEYDMKDLAKINIVSRILKKEVDEEEKFIIRKLAKRYERYDIAKSVGEYKRGFLSSIASKITDEKPLELVSRDDEEAVAWVYNELRDRGRITKVNDSEFLKSVKVPVNTINKNETTTRTKVENGEVATLEYNSITNRRQEKEIKELHKLQVQQERNADDDFATEER